MATTATSQPLSTHPRATPVAIPPPHDGEQHGGAPTSTHTDQDSDLQLQPTAPSAKRAKGKKGPDPINTSKQIEDTIALLERSQAVDKDQEIEIGGCKHMFARAAARRSAA